MPGNVQANTDAPIYARTSGYLKRWLVDIGTPVKAGQLLAEIDAPEVDQQLRQAEADLADAQAAQQIAKITADRWRGLQQTDSVSKQEADEKISLAEAAERQSAGRAGESAATARSCPASRKSSRRSMAWSLRVTRTSVSSSMRGGSSGPELFRIADMRQLRLLCATFRRLTQRRCC